MQTNVDPLMPLLLLLPTLAAVFWAIYTRMQRSRSTTKAPYAVLLLSSLVHIALTGMAALSMGRWAEASHFTIQNTGHYTPVYVLGSYLPADLYYDAINVIIIFVFSFALSIIHVFLALQENQDHGYVVNNPYKYALLFGLHAACNLVFLSGHVAWTSVGLFFLAILVAGVWRGGSTASSDRGLTTWGLSLWHGIAALSLIIGLWIISSLLGEQRFDVWMQMLGKHNNAAWTEKLQNQQMMLGIGAVLSAGSVLGLAALWVLRTLRERLARLSLQSLEMSMAILSVVGSMVYVNLRMGALLFYLRDVGGLIAICATALTFFLLWRAIDERRALVMDQSLLMSMTTVSIAGFLLGSWHTAVMMIFFFALSTAVTGLSTASVVIGCQLPAPFVIPSKAATLPILRRTETTRLVMVLLSGGMPGLLGFWLWEELIWNAMISPRAYFPAACLLLASWFLWVLVWWRSIFSLFFEDKNQKLTEEQQAQTIKRIFPNAAAYSAILFLVLLLPIATAILFPEHIAALAVEQYDALWIRWVAGWTKELLPIVFLKPSFTKVPLVMEQRIVFDGFLLVLAIAAYPVAQWRAKKLHVLG